MSNVSDLKLYLNIHLIYVKKICLTVRPVTQRADYMRPKHKDSREKLMSTPRNLNMRGSKHRSVKITT